MLTTQSPIRKSQECIVPSEHGNIVNESWLHC